MSKFLHTFEITDKTTILDVGGTLFNWQLLDCPARITLLNISPLDLSSNLPANCNYVQGDGTDLRFDSKSFDIVFSNSVIEHLYSFENQLKFASEVERVGKALWIQTPARSFFFEPHFLTPFFHFLPKNARLKLARNFTFWGWITRPSTEYIRKVIEEINLLTFQQFQSLFPDCIIQKERFLGIFTKSYIVVRK
jgi:hypothetical protein